MDSNEIVKVMDSMFTKYGQPLTESWHKFAMLKSINELCILSISIILFIIITIYIIKHYKEFIDYMSGSKEHTFKSVGFIFIIIVDFVISLNILLNISDVIISLIYPDMFWIMRLIK